MKRMLFTMLALICAGCSGEVSELSQGSTLSLTDDIVAVPRTLTAEQQAAVKRQGLSATSESFYLAFKKSELSKPYFLSAYLKQVYPLITPAAYTLGTKVVRFELQNNKLFVFDIDKRKQSSNLYDPDVVLEAYPVVTDSALFNASANASQYVLFDPSAGLNRFTVVSQNLTMPSDFGGTLTTDLQFSQRFRSIADGVQYDSVFAGHYEHPLVYNDGSVQQNLLLLNGTISVALRKYKESTGFTSFPFPERPFFFASENAIIPNSGFQQTNAARWAIKRGMAPIKWTISSRINALAADPRYSKYDIKKAVKAGIENWNSAFGFTVISASIGSDSVESGDDDKNVLVIDEDPEFTFAYADWRTNPNTGEIRGASVYFNSGWFDYAKFLFDPEALAAPELSAINDKIARTQKARPLNIMWNGMGHQHDLRRIGSGFTDVAMARARAAAKTSGQSAVPSEKELVENYITHVIVHEIGHTFSLRHNFKGSLVPYSSSVMEYVDDFDAVNVSMPQSYDIAAIKYLYDMSPDAPTQPFCTDDDVGTSDADCTPFDFGTDPLNDYHAWNYDFFVEAYLSGAMQSTSALTYYLGGVLDYVRAGSTDTQRASAWSIATSKVKPGLPASTPALRGQRADEVLQEIWAEAYLGAPMYGYYVNTPPDDLALRAIQHEQLTQQILDADGFRSAAARRQGIDVLKSLQTFEAYRALTLVRDALVTQRATATGDTALALDDLIARASVALHPYFTK